MIKQSSNKVDNSQRGFSSVETYALNLMGHERCGSLHESLKLDSTLAGELYSNQMERVVRELRQENRTRQFE